MFKMFIFLDVNKYIYYITIFPFHVNKKQEIYIFIHCFLKNLLLKFFIYLSAMEINISNEFCASLFTDKNQAIILIDHSIFQKLNNFSPVD